MDTVFFFIMVPMVYLSVTVLVLGTLYVLIRIFSSPPPASTLKIFPEKRPAGLAAMLDTFGMSTILRDKPVFWFWLVAYHIAFVLLILGHLDLFPNVNFMPADSNHMIGYGGVGVTLTLAMMYFLFRRLKSPVREISTFGDYLILLLLFFIFLSGGMMSWSNSWNENGFVIQKANFKEYFAILKHFRFDNPREILLGSHYVHVVIHVFLSNLFLMLFPFTKFAHTFLAIAANRLRRA